MALLSLHFFCASLQLLVPEGMTHYGVIFCGGFCKKSARLTIISSFCGSAFTLCCMVVSLLFEVTPPSNVNTVILKSLGTPLICEVIMSYKIWWNYLAHFLYYVNCVAYVPAAAEKWKLAQASLTSSYHAIYVCIFLTQCQWTHKSQLGQSQHTMFFFYFVVT